MRHCIARYLATAACLAFATSAMGQVFYTFESGFDGDGFDWPASPTGLLPLDDFTTPDGGVTFYNYVGNNLFFDDQYQVVGNSNVIHGAAIWANPLDTDGGELDIDLYGLDTQAVAFNFAWSAAGSPFATPDSVDIYLEDSDGRGTVSTLTMTDTFTGFGGFDGYSGTFQVNAADLIDDFEYMDGGAFIDIAYLYMDLWPITSDGPDSEFAIDNFSLDGGGGEEGEVFPSVNGGSVNVSGSTISSSILRGSGTTTFGIEVTNGTSSDTTYSTQLVPGGDLTDNGQVTDAFIAAGDTSYTPAIASLDRSLPTGSYQSNVVVINSGDPFDPDNTVTLEGKLFDGPSLSGNFADVDVSAGDRVELSNAAAAVNGFRASVLVTGTSATGPFAVSGFEIDTPVKPGQMLAGDVAFAPLGLLSGTYNGTFTASLEMAAYAGQDDHLKVFLRDAQAVDDVNWSLSYTLADKTNQAEQLETDGGFAQAAMGINNSHTAATIVGGVSSSNQTVSLSFAPDLGASDGASTPIGSAVDVDFTIPGDLYVLQLTYSEADVPSRANESDLRILIENSGGELTEAVLANSDGGGVGELFLGSYDDYLALEGMPGLSDFGIDLELNRVWAVLDVQGAFQVGLLNFVDVVLGDLDGNGVLNAFDVAPFELALADKQAYIDAYPGLDPEVLGDMDGSGGLDAFDVSAFEVALASVGQSVPEPTALLMLTGAGMLIVRRIRPGRRSV